METNEAIQDYYPTDAAQCYGCGKDNAAGHQFKTRWVGPQTTQTRFTPDPGYTALPGFVYGGLVACLVDCSGTASAALAGCAAHNRDFVADGSLRYVTGTLTVKYLKPTPLGPELVCTGHIDEVKGRKVTVSLTVTADGDDVATGQVIALEVPDTMRAPSGG